MNAVKISLIVCTYNRARLLSRFLGSACNIGLKSDGRSEIVIVDNASADTTQEVITHFRKELPIIAIMEPRQGKTYALNRAIGVSKGEYLLFADDDVVLHHEWAAAFVAAAAAFPGTGWFGGRVKPDWDEGRPGWFRQETAAALSGYFGDYDLGSASRPYTAGDKLPLGASLAVRREVFDAIGGFRTDLGPRGTLRGVGDETEFLERAVAAGFKGYYVAEASVLHHVGHHRLKISGFINYGIGKGLNHYRIGTENRREGSMVRAAGQLIRAVPQLLKGRGDRARICLINVGIELGRMQAARKSGG